MQIQTLKVFCDLVATASFSEAAKRNSITQSAVSQQIRTLETRYGVTFFERGNKNFSITPEGEAFHSSARRILEVFVGIEDSLNALKDVVGGKLKISTIGSIGFHDLPPRVEAFREAFPEVDLTITYGHVNEVYDDVTEGRVDLGLVAYPAKRSGIIADTFSKERLVLACAPGHKLAGRKRIKVTDLDGLELVSFEPDQPTRRALDRQLKSAGVKVITHLEFDNIETAKRAVEVTGSMCILPEGSVRGEVEAGTLCSATIEGEGFWRPLAVLRRHAGTTSQAMRVFLDHLSKG